MRNKTLKNTTRRDFLKGSVAAVAGIAASGLALAPARKAKAGVTNISISAQHFSKTLIDGASIPSWRFNDGTGQTLGSLTAALNLIEGEQVSITLSNDLLPVNGGRPVNLVIPGVPAMQDTAAVAPGDNLTYPTFTAPAAGSYMFYDDINGELGRAMGLLGSMVVAPVGMPSNLYSGGGAFDLQYPLVLHELDDRLNLAIDMDNTQSIDFDTFDYEPNYFFLNGLSTPDTMMNPDTLITMEVGQDIAMRYINAGLIVSPMHTHGYHVQVISRDRVLETDVVDKDVMLVKPGECVDVILPCNQEGNFPMHTHYVPATQANGVYINPVGGANTMLVAVPPP